MKEKFPLVGILKLLEQENNFVFLESAKIDPENYLSYLFLRPKRVISTFRIDEIENCFSELDQALKKGYYVAGFVSYEAGEAFEERLKAKKNFDFPLLWFGVYQQPLIYNHRKQKFEKRVSPGINQGNIKNKYLLKNIRPNISQNSYLKAIARIKDLIAQGFTYQVNYTFKLKFLFSGSPFGLYFKLRNNQSVSYSALIKTNRYNILSFSPELFFRKKGQAIITRPMKGTAKRGKDLQQDCQIAKQLQCCPKNRSENVMIVDLLRNDLGRLSKIASVHVPRLFKVEKYETLFQMTSDIESRLTLSHSAFDIFRHIFPSGSVTGAPKIKTMQIIRQLEKEPRDVYTGSIGFFSPQKTGTFNVAIRTLLIDTHKKSGEMGVGSGIVYDSDPKKEYAECCLKADFLTKSPGVFKLIETMLWQPDKGYSLLDEHLKRLENSARYFDFLYKRKDINLALLKLQTHLKQKTYRVRLLLNKDGGIKLEPSLLKEFKAQKAKINFSAQNTHTQDTFLYHKTTKRTLYDQQYQKGRRAGFYDVIFTNEKGEVTEGAISNIFVLKRGKLYTPPITCGLLNGVYRRYLLNSQKYPVKEKVLFKQDLLDAEEIYLSNSVRELVKVQLETKNH